MYHLLHPSQILSSYINLMALEHNKLLFYFLHLNLSCWFCSLFFTRLILYMLSVFLCMLSKYCFLKFIPQEVPEGRIQGNLKHLSFILLYLDYKVFGLHFHLTIINITPLFSSIEFCCAKLWWHIFPKLFHLPKGFLFLHIHYITRICLVLNVLCWLEVLSFNLNTSFMVFWKLQKNL